MKPVKTPWRLAMEKRARKQERLVQLALTALDGRTANSRLPTQHKLGIHLGLLALANSSPKVVEMRERARWILHWLIGYLLDQGYNIDDIATDNGLAALEAIAVIAGTAKQPREKQPKVTNNVMYTPDGTMIDEPWQEVYQSARKFINAMDAQAR